jgi:hypothetical protein
MKSAIASCLLLALAVGGAVGAQNATCGAGLGKVSGQAYVRVADWAKVQGFEVRWPARLQTGSGTRGMKWSQGYIVT